MIFKKYNEIADSISGWYAHEDINPIIHRIHLFHQNINLFGDICEIGVYHGKFFLAMCCLKQKGEVCLAIDSFGTNNSTDWMYGDGDSNKRAFENNYKKLFGETQNYILIQKQSAQITASEIMDHLKNKIRFFSIDGNHTLDGAYNDLNLSKNLISQYGTIIVDDYTNPSWPEVKQAVDEFLSNNLDIGILKIYANKIFLCFKEDLMAISKEIE